MSLTMFRVLLASVGNAMTTARFNAALTKLPDIHIGGVSAVAFALPNPGTTCGALRVSRNGRQQMEFLTGDVLMPSVHHAVTSETVDCSPFFVTMMICGIQSLSDW